MARKSRVNLPVQTASQTPQKTVLKTALYARLSKETDVNVERGTMDNQINYIREYIIAQNDLELYDIYADDCTGTTFDRPEFERMMSDMRKGNIDAVVVKDLSRLGRDHIETGNYIDNVFPMFNVRFIAINDGYDSEKNSDGFMAAVTNIANAMYAKDISKKVITVFRRKMEQGIPIGSVPYGYKTAFDENNKKIMVIDEYAAGIVRRIFDMYISGVNKQTICNILNAENILTPMQYRLRNKNEAANRFSGMKWYLEGLSKIIRNEVYTGKYIMGKREQALYKNAALYSKDESEWYIFENHHEAIISENDYAKAKARTKPYCQKQKPEPNIFRKKIFCGHCGAPEVCMGNPKTKRYYRCSHRVRYGKGSCECGSVDNQIVETAVFEQIKIMIKLLLDIDEITAKIKASDEYAEKKRNIGKVYAAQLDRLKELEKQKNDMYMHLCEGLIDESEYLLLNRSYTDKIKATEEKLAETEKTSAMLVKSPMDDTSIRESIKAFKNKRKLSRDMVEAFIDKIIIYDKTRIEIVFSFNDEIKEIIKTKAGEIL